MIINSQNSKKTIKNIVQSRFWGAWDGILSEEGQREEQGEEAGVVTVKGRSATWPLQMPPPALALTYTCRAMSLGGKSWNLSLFPRGSSEPLSGNPLIGIYTTMKRNWAVTNSIFFPSDLKNSSPCWSESILTKTKFNSVKNFTLNPGSFHYLSNDYMNKIDFRKWYILSIVVKFN